MGELIETVRTAPRTATIVFVGGLLTGVCAVTCIVCFLRRRPKSTCDLEQGEVIVDPVNVDAVKSLSADATERNPDSGTTYVEPFKTIEDVDVEKIQGMQAAALSGSP